MGLILLYHRIAAVDVDPWSVTVSPERFAEHLDALNAHYRPTPLRRLADGEMENRPIDGAVALTFDDGGHDLLRTALPMIERAGAPATAFLVSDVLEGKIERLWWDELEELVLGTSSLPSELELELASGSRRWSLEEDGRGQHDPPVDAAGAVHPWRAWEVPPSPRHRLYVDLWHLLRDLQAADRLRVLQDLRSWSGTGPRHAHDRRRLTASEARQLCASDLVEAGSHSASHARLSRVEPADLELEISSSRRRLTALLGDPIRTFAYPFGAAADVSAAALQEVEDAGYQLACANQPGVVGPTSDRFFLPRLYVEDWDGDELLRRIREFLPESERARPRRVVQMGALRRLEPVSRSFGYDRGSPIDRFYVERFLERHELAIRGRVLEVGDDTYTRRYGGSRVTSVDVLHVREGNPRATVVADLAHAPQLDDASYDCVVLTQTLQLIADPSAALRTVARVLRPGGAILATLPGVSAIARDEWGASWHWGFGPVGTRRLFAAAFSPQKIAVESFGNVLTATAFLQGMAAEDLTARELAAHDAQYALLIGVVAVRPSATMEIVEARIDSGPLISGWIDSPGAGTKAAGSRLQIEGWAVGVEGPVKAIEVSTPRGPLARGELDIPRPDVAAVHPAAASRPPGFAIPVDVGRSDEVTIGARLANGQYAVLAELRLAHAQREPALVSIVIPCFDQAAYLGEAIASALDQSYPRVEVLVVDDGSSDNTSAVAQRFKGVNVIRHENRGMCAARNTGMERARGDFILFLDADDRLLRDAVKSGMQQIADRPDHAFVFGRHREIDLRGRPLRNPPSPPTDDVYESLLTRNVIAMHATVLYRRDALPAAPLDPSLLGAEDYDLFLRLARRYPTGGHSAIVAEYRKHGTGLSDNPARMLTSTLQVLERHRPQDEDSPRWRQAWEDGVKFWRRYYGDALEARLRDHLAARRWRAAAAAGLSLLRVDPGRFMRRSAARRRGLRPAGVGSAVEKSS